MAENKTNTNQKKSSVLYALSIHLKHGEVLHVEGINQEERDQYINVAKTPGETMLLESKEEVRILRNEDIAKISTVSFNENYLKSGHLVKRLFLNETSIGRRAFSNIIKFFVFLCFVVAIAQLSIRVIDGTIMDVLFDPEQFVKMISDILTQLNTVFKYILVLMVLLNLLDMMLGLRKEFYINQDGAPWIETTVISNFLVTIVFVVAFIVVKVLANGIVQML